MTEVCDFRDNKAALANAGFVLLGVSSDPRSAWPSFATRTKSNTTSVRPGLRRRPPLFAVRNCRLARRRHLQHEGALLHDQPGRVQVMPA